MNEHRPIAVSSPLHSSTLGLRRSTERNLERQPSKFYCFQNQKHISIGIFLLTKIRFDNNR